MSEETKRFSFGNSDLGIDYKQAYLNTQSLLTQEMDNRKREIKEIYENLQSMDALEFENYMYNKLSELNKVQL